MFQQDIQLRKGFKHIQTDLLRFTPFVSRDEDPTPQSNGATAKILYRLPKLGFSSSSTKKFRQDSVAPCLLPFLQVHLRAPDFIAYTNCL